MAGIVRRIDELGRIVIPKELRRTMVIRNGEQLEMTQISSTEILVKKFSQLETLSKGASAFCKVIKSHTNAAAMLTDKMSVLCVAGLPEEFLGVPISNSLFAVMEERVEHTVSDDIRLTKNDEIEHGIVNVFPIIVNGDVYGSFVVLGRLNDEGVATVRAVTACASSQLV